ncbi:unnamed protein product, partial [Symbiodinium pilosum]
DSQEHQLFRLAENCLWEQFTAEGRRTNSYTCRYIADLQEATKGLLWNDLFVHLKGKLVGPHHEDFVRLAADIHHLSASLTMTALERNLDVVEYPAWDDLPGATRRDWALFCGQDISLHEVLNPPMQVLAEFMEDVPMGMQREFPLGQRRVCPDVCTRQTCRRPHCECIHPDFVDHAWVPLNSPCRNFFRGHCTKEGGCPNLQADTFPEAVYAAFRQLTMKRPSTRLHYVQRRAIFRFVTRSEAMDMILTSLTTSDTMAIKQFIMGMSWTKFSTASSYDNHLARGGVPEMDPRTSKGGYGRHGHRARFPTPTRSRFPSPRRDRAPSATPTLSRPLQTTTSSSSTSGSAPSFGQPAEQQSSAARVQAPPIKAMPKDLPAHLGAPKRAPSPHNKQPARQRAESPTDVRTGNHHLDHQWLCQGTAPAIGPGRVPRTAESAPHRTPAWAAAESNRSFAPATTAAAQYIAVSGTTPGPPTPQQFPPAALPPLHPAPSSQPSARWHRQHRRSNTASLRKGGKDAAAHSPFGPRYRARSTTHPHHRTPSFHKHGGTRAIRCQRGQPSYTTCLHQCQLWRRTMSHSFPLATTRTWPLPRPWFVNTSMLQAVEFALDYHVTKSRLTDFGLVIQAPNTYRRTPTVERVLIMPLPAQGTDRAVLVTRAYVWALVTGDLRQVGFNNPESCYLVLRDYMALAVHVRRFTQDRPSVERYIMAFTDAVLDCVCFMLPMAWRTRFTDDWAQVVTVSGNPPRLHWRRGM